jgi:hypothetical protein
VPSKKSQDPLHQDISNKSRSLGRKTNEKSQMLLNQNMPYGPVSNTRDSSVSNNSTQIGAYTSVGGMKKQLGLMNNFMPSHLPQSFYNAAGPDGQNYNYEIQLGNKAAVSSSQAARSKSNDYDRSTKATFSNNRQNNSQPRTNGPDTL